MQREREREPDKGAGGKITYRARRTHQGAPGVAATFPTLASECPLSIEGGLPCPPNGILDRD